MPVASFGEASGTGSRERIRYWTAPELGGIELLSVDFNEHLWRVYHESYALCVVPQRINSARSRCDWRYRGRNLAFIRGQTSLMEPGELHVSTRMQGPRASFWVLHVPPSLIDDLAGEMNLPTSPHLKLAQTDAPELIAALEGFYRSYRCHEGPLELQSRLAVSLRLMLVYAGECRPSPVQDIQHPALERAREYLHAYFTEPVTLDDLVSVTGLSRFHLVRSFHRDYGLPPHAYQNQLRVAAVRDALRKGERIADIHAGFYDQSHLVRHFKRVMGITPRVYASAAGLSSAKRVVCA